MSSIAQKEVIFLTDLQAASWRPPAEAADALKRLVARLEARRPRSVVIDLGKSGGENRAVTDLKLDVPVVTVGSHVSGSRRRAQFRQRPAPTGRRAADGRRPARPRGAARSAAGEDVPVVFRQQFTTPGDHLVEVSIDDDPLTLDNHRWLVVPVRESLNVLLVDGHFKSEPYQAETDYLAQALSPSEESPGQPRPIKVEVVSESQLSRRELAPYDVVVLCNVAQFSQPEVAALEDFLKQGGGRGHLRRRSGRRRQLQPAALRRRQGACCRPRSARAWATPPRRRRASSSIRWAIGIR